MQVIWEGVTAEVKTPDIQERIKELILGRAAYKRRTSRRWEAGDDEVLERLASQGKPTDAIAQELGRTYASVKSRQAKLKALEKEKDVPPGENRKLIV